MKERSNIFYYQLVYFVVDETHLMLGCKKFCKKFNNVEILQLAFSKVSIIPISVIITPNIFK